MAKKKVENIETSGSIDFFGELDSELKKEGSFNFSEFDDVQIKETTGLDILDAILASSEESRGFQLRTFNLFYGNSGSGKSTILLQMAYSFIKNNEGQIIYYDGESTLVGSKDRITKLGIDEKRVKIIQQDTTVENYYRLVNRICNIRGKQLEQYGEEYIMKNPIIVIVDSFTALATEREIDSGTDINSALGTEAKLHSRLLKQQINLLFKYNITVLGIAQTRDTIQIGPTPKAKELLYTKQDISIGGGNSLKFYSFYLVGMRTKKKLDESFGKDGGVEVELTLIKSKTSPAGKPITLIFFPTTGFSNLWTNFKIMQDSKVITNAGAYKAIPGYEKKFFTRDLETLYNTDEEFRLNFDKQAKETLKTYIASIVPIEGLDESNKSLEMLAEDLDE